MKRALVLLIICFCCLNSGIAQKQKIVSGHGSATYIVPSNISREDAIKIAIARAKDDAFIAEFGENLSNFQVATLANGKESFSEYSSTTEISRQYEWLEDTKEPAISFEIDGASGETVIHAEVWGKFRKLGTRIEIEYKVLCNGIEKDFISGDQVSVSVKSPENGFLAIFTKEESGYSYCWLPYFNEDGHPREIKHNQFYKFLDAFDPTFNDYLRRAGSPLTLVTDKAVEKLTVWFIFSPNVFSLPTMEYDRGAECYYTKIEDLDQWYYRAARDDSQLQKFEKTVIIKKR